MVIVQPIDIASVASVVAVAGGGALLLSGSLYIAFRLAQRFIFMTSMGVDSARDYVEWGTDERKLRRAYRVLERHGE
jgi:hypothetical protein